MYIEIYGFRNGKLVFICSRNRRGRDVEGESPKGLVKAEVDLGYNWNNTNSCKYSSGCDWISEPKIALQVFGCACLLESSSILTPWSSGFWLLFGVMWSWVALSYCIGNFCCDGYCNLETSLPEEEHGEIILVPPMPHLTHPQVYNNVHFEILEDSSKTRSPITPDSVNKKSPRRMTS